MLGGQAIPRGAGGVPAARNASTHSGAGAAASSQPVFHWPLARAASLIGGSDILYHAFDQTVHLRPWAIARGRVEVPDRACVMERRAPVFGHLLDPVE